MCMYKKEKNVKNIRRTNVRKRLILYKKYSKMQSRNFENVCSRIGTGG